MADIRIKDLATTALALADDDYIELDGVTKGSRRGQLGILAGPIRSALAPRGGIILDKTQASSYVRGSCAAIGTGDISVSVMMKMPSGVTAHGAVWVLSSTATNRSGNYVELYDDNLIFYANGSFRAAGIPPGTIPFGKWAHVVFTRSGATLKLYVNGADVTPTVANPPLTSDSWDTAYYQLGSTYGGDNSHNEPISNFAVFNCALSAADVLEIYEAGGTVPVRLQWRLSTNQTSGTLTVGRRYRITTYVAGDSFTNVGAASNASGQEFTATGTTPTTWTNASTLNRIGAVVSLPLNDGAGFQFRDESTNKLHALGTTTGITHLLPSSGPLRLRYTSDGTTTTPEKLCGGTTLPATAQILRIRARSQSGTPSITLGTASGGSQVVASVALSTTWKNLTIALTDGVVSANTDLWVTASAANVVEFDIEWEPLSA